MKIIWIFLVLSLSGYAQTSDRRAWFFRKLVAGPDLKPVSGSQVALGTTHSKEVVSVQARALFDLRELELGVRASEQISLSNSEWGSAFKSFSPENKRSFGVELARTYRAASGLYGRLGAEYIHFLPSRFENLHFGVTSGNRLENGYSIGFDGHFVLPLQKQSVLKENSFLLLQVELLRDFEVTEKVKGAGGGFLGWCHRNRTIDLGVPQASYEHMSFIVGGVLEFDWGWSRLRFEVPLRLWLDYEVFETGGQRQAAYPTELEIAAELSGTIYF